MRRIFLTLGLLFVFCGAHAEKIKLMVYNVENYNLEDRLVEGTYRKAYPKPEAQKAALIEVIKAQRPDILAVEEMGAEEFLAEFQTRLKAAGVDLPYVSLVNAVDPKRHVAVLSRLPFKSTRYSQLNFIYRGAQEPVLRGLMEASFTLGNKTWRIYVVHLKSRITQHEDDPDATEYRTSEAQTIRDLILRNTTPDDAFMIVGDFNDGPRSSALKRFLVKGKREIAQIVPLADARGDVWTHYWKAEGAYSRIDYILASAPMRLAIVPGSGQIVEGDAVRAASDHRPLIVTFETENLKGAHE